MTPRRDPIEASRELDRLLTRTIEELGPKKDTPMRGLQRLALLSETLVRDIDAECDVLADRLDSARKRGQEATSKFRGFVESVERNTAAAEDVLNQLTNGVPLPESGTSRDGSDS